MKLKNKIAIGGFLLLVMFINKLSYAQTQQVILKNGQTFKGIIFKEEGLGKVFYEEKLLLEGMPDFDNNLPIIPIKELSVINLQNKLYLIPRSSNGITESYLFDKQNKTLLDLGGNIYITEKFITESPDGKYAILAYAPEDAETGDEYYITLVNTEKQNDNITIYTELGLPQNFQIDEKYNFTFINKTGTIKGNLLEYFKVENLESPLTNINQEVKKHDTKSKNKNSIYIFSGIIILILISVIFKKVKKLTCSL